MFLALDVSCKPGQAFNETLAGLTLELLLNPEKGKDKLVRLLRSNFKF
jgi:hypothetical protein